MIPTLLPCKTPIANTHFVTIETLESFTLRASLDPDCSSFAPPLVRQVATLLYHTVCNCSNACNTVRSSPLVFFDSVMKYYESSTRFTMSHGVCSCNNKLDMGSDTPQLFSRSYGLKAKTSRTFWTSMAFTTPKYNFHTLKSFKVPPTALAC